MATRVAPSWAALGAGQSGPTAVCYLLETADDLVFVLFVSLTDGLMKQHEYNKKIHGESH